MPVLRELLLLRILRLKICFNLLYNAGMKFRAVILNCTLKKSPQVSNTGALIKKVVKHFKMLGVDSEVIRVVDYNIPFGVSSDEGKGDEWPQILKKIKACDIFIIATPIWFGVRGSVAQLVIERLDGTY